MKCIVGVALELLHSSGLVNFDNCFAFVFAVARVSGIGVGLV